MGDSWKRYNSDDNIANEGDTIAITDKDGNVKETLEVVTVYDRDEIQPGTFVIEVKEVTK